LFSLDSSYGSWDIQKVKVKKLSVEGLDGSAAGKGVLVSVHTVDELGGLKALVGSTEMVTPSVQMDWEDLEIETSETELAIVVHSVDIGPIGFTKFFINSDLFTSTVQSLLVTEVPTFSRPIVTAEITCIPSVLVRFFPEKICVKDARETPLDVRTKYQIQLDIVDGPKVVSSVKSKDLQPEYIGLFLALNPSEELNLNLFLARGDIDKLKAEVYVVETLGDGETKLALIDCIPLKQMRLNEPVLVGSAGEGQLVLVLEREPEKSKWLMMDKVLQLQRKTRFESVYKQTFRVLIQGLEVGLLKGRVTSGRVGCGFHNYLVAKDLGFAEIVGPDLELNFSDIFVTHDPPVIGLTVRDRHGELRGLYSIPLVRSDLSFPDEKIRISVFPLNDENMDSFLLPLMPRIEPKTVVPDYAMARITVCVESASRLPRVMDSVFCAVRVVALSVPPTLLNAAEVLFLEEQVVNPMGVLGNGITVTREATADPIWYHTLEIDVYQWMKNDWLYFTVFDNKVSEIVAHACVQVGQLCIGNKELSLPLMHATERTMIPSSWLKISIPSPPAAWSTLYVTQPPAQYIRFEGELCLKLQFFPRFPEEGEPVREAQHWLPICDVYPLIIHNCPPSGVVKMSLSLLNGNVVAKSKHRFTARDNDSMSCGGIRFFFSRRSDS
jgi:hypothetical protein